MTRGATGGVAFVGAGPGRPDLITMRGCQLLQQADLVLVDDLVHPEVWLRWAAGARICACGKRGGKPGWRQEEINGRVVAAVRAGDFVVRLKGGDPTFFARLGEELDALERENIAYEIVPGVTAASGMSAYGGLLLTERGASRSVSLLTGTTADGVLDWEAAARLGRLVFYMGVLHAEAHAEELMARGISGSTPCAVVRWATRGFQQVWEMPLHALGATVAAQGIRPPALLVVGSGAAGHRRTWFERLPLFGRTVLLARPDERGWQWADALRELGAEVVNLPVQKPAISQIARQVGRPANGAVERGIHLFTSAVAARLAPALPAGDTVLAVGKGTGKALLENGQKVTLEGSGGALELIQDLVPAIRDGMSKGPLVHWTGMPRRAEAQHLARALRRPYLPIPLYTMQPQPFVLALAARLLRRLPQNTIFLATSPETTRWLQPLLADQANRFRFWALGATTEQALQSFRLPVHYILQRPDLESLIEALQGGQ